MIHDSQLDPQLDPPMEESEAVEAEGVKETEHEGGEEESMSEDECIDTVRTHADIQMEIVDPEAPAELFPSVFESDVPGEILVENDGETDPKGNVKGTFKDCCALCQYVNLYYLSIYKRLDTWVLMLLMAHAGHKTLSRDT